MKALFGRKFYNIEELREATEVQSPFMPQSRPRIQRKSGEYGKVCETKFR